MRYNKKLLLAVLLMSGAVPVIAQNGDEQDPPERATEVPTDGGFWPTPRMVERIIDRITEDGIGLYTFDAIQLEQTRTILRERVPRWMAENRAEVMSLTNEIIEAMLDKEPPTPETMAKWAGRVLPVIDGFEKEVIAITDEMREFLTDDQITVLEGEIAAFQTGLGLATNKMRDWADGRFDPRVDWIDGPEDEPQVDAPPPTLTDAPTGDDSGPQPTSAPITGSPEPPAATPAAPSDEWARFTEEFIRKYELNSDQQSKARSSLRTAQANRDNYLKKPRTVREKTEVEALLKRAQKATGDEAAKLLADAESRKKKLDEPIENEFNRLKKKLDDLLTRDQRRKALAAEGSSASQPAESANASPEKPQNP